MTTNIVKATNNLIIGALIIVVFINLIDYQVPLKPVCIKKVDKLCSTDYVYVKFNNCKTSSDKDLQDNYCILSSRSSYVTRSYNMITCANLQPQKPNFELTCAKINYAYCLLTLWFAVRLMLTNGNGNGQNSIKLSVSAIVLIKFMLFVLVILSATATFRSLMSMTRMCNCFAPVYSSDTSRILTGFYGLAAMALSNKLKNYEIFGVLFAVYGVSLFGL